MEDVKCPHFRIEIQPDEAEKEVVQYIAFIKPYWNVEDVIFERSAFDFSKGMVNTMIKCYAKNQPRDAVMVRIYNPKISAVFNRETEVKCVKHLGRTGCAPKMLMTFSNGFCYEFFHGEVLSSRRLIEKPIWCKIARTLAKIHSTPIEDVGIEKKALIDNFVHQMFESYPDKFDDDAENKILKETLPTKEVLQSELEYLLDICKKLSSPITLCHHDVRAENILWNDETNTIMFVDFENMNCDYQAVDIAAHMIRICGVNPPDFSLTPSEEFQLKWIKVYLEEYYDSTGRDARAITEKDVRTMFVQVSKFFLLLLLVEAIGSVVFYTFKVHKTKVDLLRTAVLSIEEYYRLKERILDQKSPQ